MLSLLSLLSLMITPLRSFNIDTNKKWIFSLPDSPLVGHKVLQHSDGHRNWILVTSLLKGGRQPGRLYKCALVQDKIQCEDVLLGEKVLTLKNIQPDITLTASPEWILACVQQKRRQARSVTEELNGLCTRFTGRFQVEEAFVNLTHIIKTQLNNSDQNNNNNNNGENVIDTDKLIGADNVAGISCVSSSGSDRACRESATEVAAIVLDGSGSIESEDLISKVTTSTQVTFAVVQYGAEIQTELDLWESCNAPSVLHNTMQLDSVAKTASALLQHGLNEIFSESHGSVKDTHKMTDGGELHQDPLSLTDVMSPPEMEKGLGVGHIFSKQRALKELQLLALDLEENDLFKLPGYEALEGSIWATSAKILPNDELKYENHNANNNNDYSALEDDEDDSWTEIAIVLDGSGSIEPDDFQRAKDFISTMMETFYKNCFECDFALVQYGTDIRTEFDLRDSRNAGVALQRLHNITQVRHETKTASAIQHVLDFIFSESNGSRKNAAKIIVVLTDGEMLLDNMDLTTVINSPKMAGIVRYAIGVSLECLGELAKICP
uniref:VWFA domain-containing protein n=1 Tax=Sphenodon punctatus TaxID=8508 RepID=A0A8D0L2X8_SPHPU